jgi:hypothetical protein
MRTSKSERVRAEQVSAAVDQVLQDPEARPELFDPADAEVLATARQLAQLPALLGPVEPALEQRVMRHVLAENQPSGWAPRLRLAWAAAGLVAVLLVLMWLTPVGKTAVASFMAVFRLGHTEVRIGPAYTPPALPVTAVAGSTAVRESLTLEQAQAQFAFTIPRPTYLPPSYQLKVVHSYTYPELPAWVPQPFFAELLYEDGRGQDLTLRVYSIMLGDEASISRLNLQAAPIQDVRNVDLNGRPGVLLRLGNDWMGLTWQEVVWEQDDLILALSSTHLAEEELLRIARSLR